MKQHVKAHLALLSANLFYGISYTSVKHIMPRLIEPVAFIFVRIGLAAVLFWLVGLFGKADRRRIARKDWWRILACAIFGVALNQFLFFEGLKRTEPIHASLIMMSSPLLISLLSVFLLKERWKWDKWLGLALGIGGAAMLIIGPSAAAASSDMVWGDLFIFLNASSYSLYLILVKPLMDRYAPVLVLKWVFLFGFLLVIPLSWNAFLAIDWLPFTGVDYANMFFIIIFVTFLAYLLNIYGLTYLSPGITGSYIYLQPVFAAIVSVLFYGEQLTLAKIGAACLIFGGVYLVNRGWPRPEKDALHNI